MQLPSAISLSAIRARPEPGTRIYAVGDIHGMSTLLDQLMQAILADSETPPSDRNVLVFLGDYVDRGSDSKGVIDRLIAPPPPGFERICLMGNHEDFMVRFMDKLEIGLNWLFNGGENTLESYGLCPPDKVGGVVRGIPAYLGWRALLTLSNREREAVLSDLRSALNRTLPRSHSRFLASLPHHWENGGFYFAHAGINPDRPLSDQKPDDLMWIRNPFLSADADHGRVVVHGHTPSMEPEVRHNRIGIDTGACMTGRLTCLRLDSTGASFLHT